MADMVSEPAPVAAPAASATSAMPENKRKRRPLQVVDMHAVTSARPAEELSEYERQRQKNIAENMMVLEQLGIAEEVMQLRQAQWRLQRAGAAAAVHGPAEAPQMQLGIAEEVMQLPTSTAETATRRSSSSTTARKKRSASADAQPAPERHIRTRSSRRGTADASEGGDGDSASAAVESEGIQDEAELLSNHLIPMDEYFKDKAADAVHTDGHYKGWVNPELMHKYGLEGNAKDAWEKNGGGKFSFKNILGDAAGITLGPRPAGWSKIRHQSSKLLAKNPNAYFYRHTEPGVDQWQGEWTPEEHELFLKVAKECGCGDKWGLFSTFIPHRVGYQCSNYYRGVILAQGCVFDRNYRMTKHGNVVYVGPHNSKG